MKFTSCKQPKVNRTLSWKSSRYKWNALWNHCHVTSTCVSNKPFTHSWSWGLGNFSEQEYFPATSGCARFWGFLLVNISLVACSIFFLSVACSEVILSEPCFARCFHFCFCYAIIFCCSPPQPTVNYLMVHPETIFTLNESNFSVYTTPELNWINNHRSLWIYVRGKRGHESVMIL